MTYFLLYVFGVCACELCKNTGVTITLLITMNWPFVRVAFVWWPYVRVAFYPGAHSRPSASFLASSGLEPFNFLIGSDAYLLHSLLTGSWSIVAAVITVMR